MRVSRCLVSMVLAGLCSIAAAQEDSLNHVIFSNSITSDSSFYSGAQAVAPSTLEQAEGRLPVETKVFLSPPNALRLQWQSVEGGSWDAEVRAVNIDNRPADFHGTTLSFWCYAPKAIASKDLPAVQLLDEAHNFTQPVSLGQFAGDLLAGRWTQVRIPLRAFATESVRPFDARQLHSVFFAQREADNKPHTLLVDEIRIGPDVPAARAGVRSPVAGPRKLEVEAFERHIDLKWTAPADTRAAYFVVYRSMNGGAFEPIGTQVPEMNRYTDFVGAPGIKASYKVAVVDTAYRTSAFSAPASAETHPMTDDELLTMLQEACFRYYWERGAHPVSGMTLESVPGDPRIVATGASGFGIMAMVVGMDRGFITREQGVERLTKIVGFLEHAQRYHGVWPHFMDGATGRTLPLFGMFDNGGDVVETAFLMEGLLTARQYLNSSNATEREVRDRITHLWKTVEWDWYAKAASDGALSWHWSPQWSWHINHRLTGFNETMIAYLLAIASPSHSLPANAYYSGWASQADIAAEYRKGWSGTSDGSRYSNGVTYQGIKLDVGVGSGGPLFFTQYSFMGPDPREIRDQFTNYFENNRNIALINYRYCVENPGHFKGYGEGAWGLTASLDPYGYGAHAPNAMSDNGTISPTGALGSFPYTPKESMEALKYLYRTLGGKAWGVYGPTDAFSLKENWFAPGYLGLDQAPITVMVENARTGSIWKLFMSNPEMAPAFAKIGGQPANTAPAVAANK